MKKINQVKLYTKQLAKAREIEKVVKEELLSNNINLNNDLFDLVISIGGDGTFIKMIHDNNFNDKVYYAGINAGSLGFLSSSSVNEIKSFINSLSGDFKEYEIPLLETVIETNNDTKKYLSINEFTIRKNNFSTLRCSVLVNDEIIEKYAGDGLVISTTTGSTAYNLALNGPIIDNDIEAFLLTPIAPIINQVYKSLGSSLILSGRKKLTIVPDNSLNLCILNDGKYETMENIKKISCQLSSIKLKCIVPTNYNFLKIVKSKMISGNNQ